MSLTYAPSLEKVVPHLHVHFCKNVHLSQPSFCNFTFRQHLMIFPVLASSDMWPLPIDEAKGWLGTFNSISSGCPFLG